MLHTYIWIIYTHIHILNPPMSYWYKVYLIDNSVFGWKCILAHLEKVYTYTPSFLGGYWDQTCTAEGRNIGGEQVGKRDVSRSGMGKNKEWGHNTLYICLKSSKMWIRVSSKDQRVDNERKKFYNRAKPNRRYERPSKK